MKARRNRRNLKAVVGQKSFRQHPCMSVAGCIDSNGRIEAKGFREIGSHTPELSRGKKWRWLVWSQEFSLLMPTTCAEANDRTRHDLTDEEHFAVCDWLIRHGYADDRILPNNDSASS